MSDETFIFYTPESKRVPILCIVMVYGSSAGRLVQVSDVLEWHCEGTHGTNGVKSMSPQWGKRINKASM